MVTSSVVTIPPRWSEPSPPWWSGSCSDRLCRDCGVVLGGDWLVATVAVAQMPKPTDERRTVTMILDHSDAPMTEIEVFQLN